MLERHEIILAKMWELGNPCALLVRMEIVAVAMVHMEVPQKIKIQILYDLAIPLLGISLKKTETLI